MITSSFIGKIAAAGAIRLAPALNPPGLAGGAITYDSTAEQLYLFGGYTDATVTTFPRRTWTWNGTIWNLAETDSR